MPDPQDDAKTQLQPRTGSAAAPTDYGSDGDHALPNGTKLGEFEIVALIGAGGFGIVYLAQDHSLGRRIALKEYMPSVLARRARGQDVFIRAHQHAETFMLGLRSFVNEARLLAQFDHPSLVKVFRFWEGNGTAYMAMPFYEGRTLRQALQAMASPPSESWLLTFLGELLPALEIIHGEQCYHRDIAPDNILLLPSGRPVLLDFGAARRVIGDRTQALTVFLKPGYAPLEQYADVPDVQQGAFTDLYALAAVVYCAITGKPPTPSVGRMINDTMVPLSTLGKGRYSEGFLRAIDRALAVRPEERPQTVAEFRALLGADATAPGAQATSPSSAAPALGQTGEGLRSGALAALRSRLRRQSVAPQALVFAAGEVDRDLVIVQSGEVLLSTRWPPASGLELALMGPGMAFGEVAFLNGSARTAFAGTQDQPAELVRLSRADFESWALDYPRDALAFMSQLALIGTWRLGATTQQLRDALE